MLGAGMAFIGFQCGSRPYESMFTVTHDDGCSLSVSYMRSIIFTILWKHVQKMDEEPGWHLINLEPSKSFKAAVWISAPPHGQDGSSKTRVTICQTEVIISDTERSSSTRSLTWRDDILWHYCRVCYDTFRVNIIPTFFREHVLLNFYFSQYEHKF